MCTISLHRNEERLVLLMNRDEQRSRPEGGLGRKNRPHGTDHFPVDIPSGGTWLGLSAGGYVLCLLNRRYFDRAATPPGYRSRGLLIPEALEHPEPAGCRHHLDSLDPRPHAPFEILLASPRQRHLFHWDGTRYRTTDLPFRQAEEWYMISSSSVDEASVLERRRALFDDMVREAGETGRSPEDTLLAFHQHRFADDPSASVRMAREHSCTRSLTRVEIMAGQRVISWEAVDGVHQSRHSASP